MYKTVNEHYKEKFGCKVYKLSLNGGFSCPNRDGTVGNGGCIFCTGSFEFAENCRNDVKGALEKAKNRVESKNGGGKYIAYFQSFTSTYDSVDNLKKLYYEAIEPDYIVALDIATRPDCLSDKVIDLLAEINRIKPVTVELGLQTSNEKTAEYIRRGYKNNVYIKAVNALKEKGIETVTHIIIGLPFETGQDAVNTTRFAVNCGTNGVKFHLLHVLCGTELAKEYAKGVFKCLTLEEYGKILKSCIDTLPESTVVHRITGDGAKSKLIAPLWSADKKKTLNYLNRILINS